MLKYYFSSEYEPSETPTNDGIESVSGLLDQLHTQGVPVDRIDVAELTEKGRADAYMDAVRASVLNKYKIRQVFGSKRISGTFFGKQVPALILRNIETEHPEEVYPHQEPGEFALIAVFLRAYIDQLSKNAPINPGNLINRDG